VKEERFFSKIKRPLYQYGKAAFFNEVVIIQRVQLPDLTHRGFLELMRYRSGALLTRSNDLNFI
jgi:hypothetical protein